MSYASDCEFTRAEAAVELCKFVQEHKHLPDWSFTIQDAMRVTGRGYRWTCRLLLDIDRALGTYIDEEQARYSNGRWSRVRRKVLRG